MAWLILVIAGLMEVGWAVGLKYAEGFRRPLPSVLTLVAMVASVYLLAQAVKTIPIGAGYAIWTGIGAVGTALYGILVLGEPAGALRLACLVLIVSGIVGLKFTSGH